jgi:hypothetical protein
MLIVIATVHHGNGNTVVARYIASAVNAVNNVAGCGCVTGVIAGWSVAVIVVIIVSVSWILTYALQSEKILKLIIYVSFPSLY